ncbi:hydroxyectoine utilization dehydratase EutB [Pseudalkalibacillus caeni]|uniref:threonine ammonia-lyase n=1 Tax=Exobacillus caeni TaxID=2574798 RepID=A0A5R9F3I8_9BACL|nr:hydroxyectoine utilization dehydratase EutB [Pseudalkalibacillus caeni]TLS36148.1 hydroxyectoine utilization dehydratase EutB [Pseudalkalibacillus caeni]
MSSVSHDSKSIKNDVSLREVWKARKRISAYIEKTPLLHSPLLSQKGAAIHLKMENLQPIGAFKIRGAANKILSLSQEEKERGVTTFSTGNHGMAVAYIAKQLGIRAIVCISNRVPKVKVDKIREMGAEVKIIGENQDDAESHCYFLENTEGITVIKPFDDPYVIAGQGTIGLELLEQFPDIDSVVVPLSGGGLLSGIGAVLKQTDPSIKVIGVSMERSAVMHESIKAERPVVIKEESTLADSLLGGIGLENEYTFQMVKRYMDEIVLLTEEEIADGMGFMFQNHRIGVEGAAATAVAAVLHDKIKSPVKQTAAIISGSNVDPLSLHAVINDYLNRN